ncbi:MAG: hypothetical protein A3G33_01865 [Omnitrophica bacterium RIFCSPLOWO2_12_FULL_44_17]|uniref:DNA-binding response regulator n=1 Tax=Candidatus Danuiimicrobium aquiferis TaxID=1801832 RepID=A0A1G1KTA7_9BACT|nr:MAG: hypothetical protein A3B72_03975 [Omnitrophica bacterium RIFCSPHIGHO2_02_FULL_45_28]OGW89095.1 MAG: hypothetical protein A3E74_05580 [Omnitrophica bacterium RIFCSPHIGHO2_12_FULL_44_12]OGW96141.1 MAG: hypothetical protein A3G33_01865 [Omnitrophica bacterium RIFCSPLOWO2_12_FULL_44_17]OGX02407.1 MAG: hypothetical protein A3J12_05680 [Omnitrophica bacterium RIFCSPLOWO2_02_FULL_44_11]
MISTFIVEDEIPARNELKRFLQAEDAFELIGEAADGEEALEMIKRLRPDIVFLDIHMPKKNGLEVAAALAGLPETPLIIFVTAYDEYAIQAFEVNAIDYILKPYDQERFKKACEKAKSALIDRSAAKEKLSSLNSYYEKGKPVKIMGHRRNSRERMFIQPKDVLFFHVELTDVTAHLFDGTDLLVNTTLKSLFEILDPAQFQQTNRAFIVNLDQVEKVIPLFSGNFEILLKGKNQVRIPLSRRYAKQLKKILKW